MQQINGCDLSTAPNSNGGGESGDPSNMDKQKPPLTPGQRTLRARLGAYSLHATHDPRDTTAKARRTFLDRFYDDVDPDRSLPPEERQRRAQAALKAHMTRLALASSRSRSKRAG
jgi:hypothetical protein